MKRHLILAFALLASSVALNAVNSLPDDDKSDNKNKTELNSVVKKTWEFYSAIKQPSADALANAGNYKFGQEAGYPTADAAGQDARSQRCNPRSR